MSVVANVAINVDSRNAVTQLQRFESATKSAAAGVAGLVASLSAGLAFGQLIKSASQFEAELSEIGKTAGASEKEITNLAIALKGLSAPSKTNLAPSILAAGVKDLVAQGLKLNDAIASMETLGKVAVATNSELTDVTKTGFQLQSALKIRPTELKETFDALAFAGKAGAFELKDMAQFMPTIASAATSIGVTGKNGAVALAAMMQMVRKDAPGAAEASTRLTDALLKMTAPETVKNFAKFGVNIEGVLKKAVKDGVNPMDAAIKELIRVTGKDQFKLSQIFGDKEAKLALQSLMKYKEEYEKLKAAAGGTAAAGTVQADFEKSLKTFNGQLQTLQTSGELVALSLGSKLLPILARLIEEILPIVNGIASFVEGMGQIPKPVIDAAIGIGKVIIQLMLIDKALKIAMAAAALFKGAMLLLTTQTTLAGAAALTGQARLLMLAGGIKGTGTVAAAATPLIGAMVTMLGRLAALGIVTVGINYVSNVAGQALSLEQLQKRRQRGGAAAEFKGATRETVTAAQAAQQKELIKLQKQEEKRKENLRKQGGLFQIPVIGPLALTAMSPGISSEEQGIQERALFAQGVMGLNPANFKPAVTQQTTPEPIGAGVTPTGKTKGGKTDAEKAAELAARQAEQLMGAKMQLDLARQLFAIENRVLAARFEGNKPLELARETQKELAQIAGEAAAITVDKEMPAARKLVELKLLEVKSAEAARSLAVDIAQIEIDRNKSFDQIIADLDLELALKTATTEQAREQLRLEAEIAKLAGQYTTEQIGAIAAKKSELARPKTDAERLQSEATAVKEELTKLTDPINMITSAAAGIGAAFSTSFKGIIDGSMTAQQALGSFFTSVADQFLDMAAQIIAKMIQMFILQQALKIFGGAAGGAFTGTGGPSAPSVDYGFTPSFGSGFAKGGVFSNSIVSAPTLFPFADGGTTRMGLMGEAGPEAIMPLKRGTDGKLGVAAQMDGAMQRYRRSSGAAGAAGDGTTATNDTAAAGAPVAIDVRYSVERINDVEYVTASQFQDGMRQAAKQGAEMGRANVYSDLINKRSVRQRMAL